MDREDVAFVVGLFVIAFVTGFLPTIYAIYGSILMMRSDTLHVVFGIVFIISGALAALVGWIVFKELRLELGQIVRFKKV